MALRWIRRALTLALLLLAARFTYTRITAQPHRPATDDSYLMSQIAPIPPGDRSAEWVAAFQPIAADPALPPPPAGYAYFEYNDYASDQGNVWLNPMQTNAGEWTPATRPLLRAMVDYLERPDVSAALERLIELRHEPLAHQFQGGPGVGLGQSRSFAKLLTARARYFAEQHRDLPAAWRDLRTVLDYADWAMGYGLIGRLVGTSMHAMALRELGSLLREHAFDADLLREVRMTLENLPDPADNWAGAFENERIYMLDSIDKCYTLEKDGGGWLVLTADRSALKAPVVRSRVWNLLSPLYYDRPAAIARADWFCREFAAAARLPWPESREKMERLEGIGILDALGGPPLSTEGIGAWSRAWVLMLRAEEERRGVLLSVALHEYRAARGVYPADLVELLPDFIDELPLDPFCVRPLHYRREPGGYLMYGCGFDGDNDGGMLEPERCRQFAEPDGDDFLVWPRRGFGEPLLVPAPPPDPVEQEPLEDVPLDEALTEITPPASEAPEKPND